jgi:hypothetical protein
MREQERGLGRPCGNDSGEKPEKSWDFVAQAHAERQSRSRVGEFWTPAGPMFCENGETWGGAFAPDGCACLNSEKS